MPSVFTRIIDGEFPSRMLWEDHTCVALLDVRPLAPGHSLVIPRTETDRWTDLDPVVAAHLTTVAHAVGQAQMRVFSPARIGLLIAGFEVPHTHVHVVPIESMHDLDFASANAKPDHDDLDRHAVDLRAALSSAGYDEVATR